MFTHSCSCTVGRVWGDPGRVSVSHTGVTRVWRESWSKLTSPHCSRIFPQASVSKCPSEYSGIQGQVFKRFVWPGAAKTQEHQLSSTHVLQIAWPAAATSAGLGSQAGGFPFRLSTPTGGVVHQRGSRRSLLLEEKGKTQNLSLYSHLWSCGRVTGAPQWGICTKHRLLCPAANPPSHWKLLEALMSCRTS